MYFIIAYIIQIFSWKWAKGVAIAELWDEDPEGFAFEEGGDSWRYSWRPCCETVFLSLFHEFRELLAPLLVQMVR